METNFHKFVRLFPASAGWNRNSTKDHFNKQLDKVLKAWKKSNKLVKVCFHDQSALLLHSKNMK